MNTTYKAVKYQVEKHHNTGGSETESWDSCVEYNTTETRYRIISIETGEILDDAQGYGYKTAQKAYAAYAYKTRDKSKDKEKLAKKKHIIQWMKEHKDFVKLMDAYAFDIAKGSMGPSDKFNAKFVKEILKENNLEPDFMAGELLRVWRNN